MNFSSTAVDGALIIELTQHADERGTFARLHCQREFEANGLPGCFVQSNLSTTEHRGTLRGMHLQRPPSAEGKLVRCLHGAIYDVAIDLRADSPTYMKHAGVELSRANRKALFVPAGCAHGFQTLTEDVEVLYEMSDFYEPDLGFGVRWNDPAFGVEWPIDEPVLNTRDATYEDFTPARAALLSHADG